MTSFSPSRARACSWGTVTLLAAFWALIWVIPGGTAGPEREFCPRIGQMATLCTAARRPPRLPSAGRWRGAAKALLRPVEEFAPAAHALDALDQQLEVLGHVDEIEALAVHDQQGAIGIAVEVARVRLREAPQVALVDARFHGMAALLHARDQGGDGGLQVHHEVRRGRLR